MLPYDIAVIEYLEKSFDIKCNKYNDNLQKTTKENPTIYFKCSKGDKTAFYIQFDVHGRQAKYLVMYYRYKGLYRHTVQMRNVSRVRAIAKGK